MSAASRAGSILRDIKPLEPFGAVVSDADLTHNVHEVAAAVRRALSDYQLLVFRGHGSLTDAQLLALAEEFGYVEPTAIAPDRVRPGFPQIYVVSNIVQDGKAIGIGRGAGFLNWHTDLSFEDRISSFGFLEAIELPSQGGETMFTNMYLLFEGLPADLQQHLLELRATHASDAAYSVGKLSQGKLIEGVLEKRDDDPAIMRANHPAVVTNPTTGRRAVYLNPQNVQRIDGIDETESNEILSLVFDQLGSPALTLELSWRSGDLVAWDQLGLNHARRPFETTERRYMRQITVQVTEPDEPWTDLITDRPAP